MPLLSLCEHDRLSIGVEHPDTDTVTQAQATALRALKKTYGFDVFKYLDEKTLVCKQYIGTVQIGDLTVEVLPKIDGLNDTQIRQNLVRMLSTTIDLDISEGDASRVSTQSHSILEILIRLFCDKLFEQVHKGLVRTYESRSENLYVLRGKIGITEQIRKNLANPEKLYCHFEEFHEDNPLNQILKASLRLLIKVSQQPSNQRRIQELLFVFDSVGEVARTALPWHKVRFNRLNTRYQTTYNLAALFLKGSPPDITGGQTQSFSLFFDMNKLFEEYVGRISQRVFRQKGFDVFLQSPQQHLGIDEATERNAFALKPDIVGMKNGSHAWIIDTKWKTLSTNELREGISQGDIYQMYAYSMRYDCTDVILLYPHHNGLGETPGCRASYRLNDSLNSLDGELTAKIRIATLDLTNLSTIAHQLDSLIDNPSTNFLARAS